MMWKCPHIATNPQEHGTYLLNIHNDVQWEAALHSSTAEEAPVRIARQAADSHGVGGALAKSLLTWALFSLFVSALPADPYARRVGRNKSTGAGFGKSSRKQFHEMSTLQAFTVTPRHSDYAPEFLAPLNSAVFTCPVEHAKRLLAIHAANHQEDC